MREGVIAYDMHRRLIRINPAFERLTGYGEDEVRDQEFLQYIHPDDRRGLLAEWDRLEQGGMLRDQEYRVVTRAGQVRWCASTWETLRDKIGRRIGFLGTEFDITDGRSPKKRCASTPISSRPWWRFSRLWRVPDSTPPPSCT